jgi:5-methyltetrahydrofolate--homocysteine methyltransferase
MRTEDLLRDIMQNVIEGRADKDAAWPEHKKGQPGVKELISQAINDKIPVDQLLNKALMPAMKAVGAKFEVSECSLPEMLIAAQALKAGMEVLKPVILKQGLKLMGKFAVGTVKGDIHDIGKSIVKMLFEGAGFEVLDLGTDTAREKFVGAVKDQKVQLLGLSSLLTSTMPEMSRVIASLKEAGLRDQVKVLVGGAPLTEEYSTQIGADGYAADAIRAVGRARQLLKLD